MNNIINKLTHDQYVELMNSKKYPYFSYDYLSGMTYDECVEFLEKVSETKNGLWFAD